MSDVEVKRWQSKLFEFDVLIIRIERKFWFFGKEVAKALRYTDPTEAIRDHVDSEDKKTIKELLGPNFKVILKRNFKGGDKLSHPLILHNLQPNQVVIKEIGIYTLCTNSRMPKARPFQRWIFETIEEIRETGSYTLSGGAASNPLSLIDKVSNLEREIKSLKKETKTYDKETQTSKSIDPSKLRNRLKRSIRKAKEIEIDLEKSLEKISFSDSDSNSSHRYSSDSD